MSRDYFKCDPADQREGEYFFHNNHDLSRINVIILFIIGIIRITIVGETFLQVTRLLQGYIENEVN